jgi:hypothetical protein
MNKPILDKLDYNEIFKEKQELLLLIKYLTGEKKDKEKKVEYLEKILEAKLKLKRRS